MGDRWLRGRLGDADATPSSGERVEPLAAFGGVRVAQIRSGVLAAPVDYEQAEDEWVVLLDGAATVVVAGETVELSAGDWLFLPAGLPHRLVETRPGSRWLAVFRGR